MTAQPAPRPLAPRLIAIASGKGGVGKTWLAITLAHALARRGEMPLLFDGDLGLANIDIQLGLAPTRDIATVLAGKARLAEAVQNFALGGFDILAGRSGAGNLAGLPRATIDALIADLRLLPHARILLDLGAGLDPAIRRMAALSDLLLVVATDEPTSLTDAYAVLKLHAGDQPVGEARIIINQAASEAAGTRTYATLARACENFLGFAPRLAGIIRCDDKVRDAIRRQTPLLTRHPSSLAAMEVDRIAGMVQA